MTEPVTPIEDHNALFDAVAKLLQGHELASVMAVLQTLVAGTIATYVEPAGRAGVLRQFDILLRDTVRDIGDVTDPKTGVLH